MIPFLDLKKVNAPYHNEFKACFATFLETENYILGDSVLEFEKAFASYCQVPFAIGTGNGLDALRLIFEGLKIQKKLNVGDEVLVAANSYTATVLAIIQAGLKPVFVEVETQFFNIDLNKIPPVSKTVKAVVVTHLYGQMQPVRQILAFAEAHNLILVEDASQSHGAKLNGKYSGSFGIAAAFSCYPTKNLGALGDAGISITSDPHLAELVLKLRNYGRSSLNTNEYLGFNSRLDTVQAQFLNLKLRDLENCNNKRMAIATRYLHEIINPHIELPYWDYSQSHVFYVFVVRVKNRTSFISHLNKLEIGYAIHYPVVAYKQPALKSYSNLKFEIAEQLADTCISIPLNTSLSQRDITLIIAALNAYEV